MRSPASAPSCSSSSPSSPCAGSGSATPRAAVRTTTTHPGRPTATARSRAASRSRPATAERMPLDHVALTVADRERSAAFYAEHFGLTERVHDDEHLLILGDGAGSLLSFWEGDPGAVHLAPRNHFGFSVATPADV